MHSHILDRLKAVAVALAWWGAVQPADAQSLVPRDGANLVNPDVQIALTFKAPPRIGRSGQVRIYVEDSTVVGTREPTTIARSPLNGGRFSYPCAEVVLLNATLLDVASEGWGDADRVGNIRFWEHDSRGPDGSKVDVSRRVPWSRQLDAMEDATAICEDRRSEFVLAGWKPSLEVRVK